MKILEITNTAFQDIFSVRDRLIPHVVMKSGFSFQTMPLLNVYQDRHHDTIVFEYDDGQTEETRISIELHSCICCIEPESCPVHKNRVNVTVAKQD